MDKPKEGYRWTKVPDKYDPLGGGHWQQIKIPRSILPKELLDNLQKGNRIDEDIKKHLGKDKNPIVGTFMGRPVTATEIQMRQRMEQQQQMVPGRAFFNPPSWQETEEDLRRGR